MKCVLAAIVLLLAATTCPAAEDPLESLNTVEDTLNVMVQQRCEQQLRQGVVDAASPVQQYRGDGDDAGASFPSQPLNSDDSCTSNSSETSR